MREIAVDSDRDRVTDKRQNKTEPGMERRRGRHTGDGAGHGDGGAVLRAGSKISGGFFICRNLGGGQGEVEGNLQGRGASSFPWDPDTHLANHSI